MSSVSSASSLRMAGLVTGLDTESIVDQMTAGTKLKINSQQQKLDLLQWKQENYRSVITKITAFRDQYLDVVNKNTYMGSSSLYSKKTASSSVSGITATASSSAPEGTINVSKIIQKATAASISSGSAAVNGIKLDYSNATDGESYTVSFNLDGLTKDVTFVGGADETATQTNFLTAVNDAFNDCDVSFNMDSDGDALIATDTTNPLLKHTFTIDSTTENKTELAAIGLEEKASSQITTGKLLSDMAFVTPLNGEGYSFTINDVEFNFSNNSSLYQVMSQINNSDAGVNLSYSNITNKFTLETTSTGMGSALSITQESGNLLTAMFGQDSYGNDIVAQGSYLQSSSIMSDKLVGDVATDGEGFGFTDGVSGDISELINQSINVTVNGETQKISLWQYDTNGNKNTFESAASVTYQLNNSLKNAFGSDCPSFEYDETTQKFSLVSTYPNDEISVSALADTEGGSEKLLAALGFNDTNSSNIVDTSKKLSDFFTDLAPGTLCFSSDTSKTFDVTSDTTLQELMDAAISDDGESLITLNSGMLELKGINEGASDKASLETIFGECYHYPGIPPIPPVESKFSGTNAIIEITQGTDNVQITSSTNSFDVGGTTINVSGADVGEVDATITTTKDTSDALDTIKSFVEDYNALISDLNTQISTPRPTSDGSTSGDKYEPLTDDQREEMSDTEIENWEKQAKIGLLYQDDKIQSFLTDIRSAITGGGGSAIPSLEKMGITISTDYKDNGKLVINETKLQAALQEDPDSISDLFSDPDTGIAALVKNAVNKSVATTGATKGNLILLAGASTSYTTENTITKQLEEYKERIEDLQEDYEDEQERYWAQFTALETLTSKYNSQSEWLTSQFSS